MKNNNIIEIQEMLMREMKRLDNDAIMQREGKEEVARGNALSQSANTFIKSVNLGLRVIEVADKTNTNKTTLAKELGIDIDD